MERRKTTREVQKDDTKERLKNSPGTLLLHKETDEIVKPAVRNEHSGGTIGSRKRE